MAKNHKFIGFVLPNGIVDGQTIDSINNDGGIYISVSVCYYINKEYEGFDPDKPRYNDFYATLQKLKNPNSFLFTVDGTPLNKPGIAATPFALLENELIVSELIDKTGHDNIKNTLWEAIFPMNKSINMEGNAISPNTGKINSLFGESYQSLHHLNSFMGEDFSISGDNSTLISKKQADKDLLIESSEILNKANEFGVSQMKISYANNLAFLKSTPKGKAFIGKWGKTFEELNQNSIKSDSEQKNFVTTLTSYYTDLIEFKKEAVESYIESTNIDIDEIINNYTAVSHETSLMRLMGLIQDCKIFIPKSVYEKINFKLGFKISNYDTSNDILELPTQINVLKKENKLAFLVSDSQIPNSSDSSKKSTYYKNSILKQVPFVDGANRPEFGSKLIRVDKMAIENKLKDREKKFAENGNIEHDDIGDALTRGILFTNPILNKIISPQPFIDTIVSSGVTDDFVIRGHRVGLIQVVDEKQFKLFSLTKRDIDVSIDKKKKAIFKSTNFEGCISFDTPTQYMQDGEINSAISDVLFEYSGELLSLKSAFSRATKIDSATNALNKIRYHHDSGLFKSQARFEAKSVTGYDKVISFFHYPFNEIETKTSYLSISYDIPRNYTQSNSPKLRFGNEYTFVVYQEYLNGWGLPISPNTKNKIQLSLSDVVIPNNSLNEDFVPTRIKFNPLENKRAVNLFHRKEVHDDSSKPLNERASLEHLVVRSDSGEDSDQTIDERHILPPQIELEHAFWHNLLSPPKMNANESFKIKTRYNCPFADKGDYDKYVNEKKGNKCHECWTSYCGGTQMKTFYSEKHITPKFLTDPTVIGFKVELFWDKECHKQVRVTNYKPIEAIYGGVLGTKPNSYLLHAGGADEEIFIENHNGRNTLEIYLKKGANIYCQITNTIEEQFKKAFLEDGWWKDLGKKFTTQDLKVIQDGKNVPKQIVLTHAVKEPLITPKVLKLFSTPNDHKHIEHINEWLKEKEYQHYKIGINIIANRIDKNNPNISLINSSYTKVELSSHFERLDAIRKIEFLRDITPTGVLELWMRKEEFIDNPEQFVLPSKSETNHIPSEPVVSFVNSKFNLDYKIEFSNEIMSQLKDLKRVEDIDGINDVFRSLVTKLNLKYDFKTTCFEEREYYLKDISKFKGFFTDENFNTDSEKALEKLEDYALPKITNVKSKSELRFKVLVLNNSQPSKPDVAFAVTTIQETRTNPSSKKTISIQKGNIVTIYLKRGRLKSGKDERVGVIVDADSLYNKIFKDSELISKAGRDIVSDRYSNRSQYLQYGDIIIPENNEYKAAFDNELGIYHFLPKFDIEKQLWKFEVELDIKTEDGKQIHNPFINFSLVHFQPFSINYNNKTADASLLDLKNDCRISDIENSTWCYLLPERKLSVFFDTPGWFDDFGDVDLTVSFDYESLHHFNSDVNRWKVRSNFIVTVQGSNDGIQWQPVQSWFDNGKSKVDESTLAFHHPLLSEEILNNQENLAKLKLKFMKWVFPNNTEKSKSYSYFRVRFIEVEWFTNETWLEILARNKELLSVDAVDNEEMRIRFVELIY